jgi:hypothetical protein
MGFHFLGIKLSFREDRKMREELYKKLAQLIIKPRFHKLSAVDSIDARINFVRMKYFLLLIQLINIENINDIDSFIKVNEKIADNQRILPIYIHKKCTIVYYYTSIELLEKDKHHIKNLNEILSENYYPPGDSEKVLSHLGTLILCYEFLKEIEDPSSKAFGSISVPPLNLRRFDYAMATLVSDASIILSELKRKIDQTSRTKKSTKKKMANAGNRRNKVEEEFYRLDWKIRGKGPYSIASQIRTKLMKKYNITCSQKTVVRDLQKLELVRIGQT